jgi:hypothetical protein
MQRSVRIQSQPYPDYKTSQLVGRHMVFLFLPSCMIVEGIIPMKYRMLIKMGSEVLFVAASLWADLIVIHHKASDTLRLSLYQVID